MFTADEKKKLFSFLFSSPDSLLHHLYSFKIFKHAFISTYGWSEREKGTCVKHTGSIPYGIYIEENIILNHSYKMHHIRKNSQLNSYLN